MLEARRVPFSLIRPGVSCRELDGRVAAQLGLPTSPGTRSRRVTEAPDDSTLLVVRRYERHLSRELRDALDRLQAKRHRRRDR